MLRDTVEVELKESGAEKMREYPRKKLAEIFAKHAAWLHGEPGGARANLSRAVLHDADLSNAVLHDADLSNAVLYGAVLRDAVLSGASLSGADLRGANLSADLYGANLSGATLSHANLRRADLRNTGLSNADLYGADLSNAVLYDADLSGADLRDAVLSGASLSNADLRGANLRGANLRGADLRSSVGFLLLPVQDMRGYSWPHAVWVDGEWRVRGGCRDFTVPEALEHFGPAYGGDRAQADLYLYALDWLQRQPTPTD